MNIEKVSIFCEVKLFLEFNEVKSCVGLKIETIILKIPFEVLKKNI